MNNDWLLKEHIDFTEYYKKFKVFLLTNRLFSQSGLQNLQNNKAFWKEPLEFMCLKYGNCIISRVVVTKSTNMCCVVFSKVGFDGKSSMYSLLVSNKGYALRFLDYTLEEKIEDKGFDDRLCLLSNKFNFFISEDFTLTTLT